MGLLGGETRRETAIAWVFVIVQAALIVLVVVLPAGDTWSVGRTVGTALRWLSWAGLAALVLGLVGLGRSATALPTPVPHGQLRTGGPYRFVRHPIYSGLIVLVLGSAIPSGNPWSLAAAVALTGWLSAKARWEEGQLRRRYPGYARYAEVTPRFVPGWPFGADRR